MTEIAVTLTDYGLCLLCAYFAWRILARDYPSRTLRRNFSYFFLSLCFASLVGGTVHGFFGKEGSLGFKLLWSITLILIGWTAYTTLLLGGQFCLNRKSNTILKKLGFCIFILYILMVLFVIQNFWLAIAFYVPTSIFFLCGCVVAFYRYRISGFVEIAGGILVSFIAAGIQQMKIGIHPLYFDHNATYHVLQGCGLYLIASGAIQLSDWKNCEST